MAAILQIKNGLLIFHVDYDKAKWCNGKVNIADNHYRYDMFHADRKGYRDWNPNNQGSDFSKYTMDNWLRSRYFSTSPYPYTDSTTYVVNDSLTDYSDSASVLFTANAEGKNFMGKAITNIKLSEDGTISFDFMNPNSSGVSILAADEKNSITGGTTSMVAACPLHPIIRAFTSFSTTTEQRKNVIENMHGIKNNSYLCNG